MASLNDIVNKIRHAVQTVEEAIAELRNVVYEFIKTGQIDYIVNLVVNVISSVQDPYIRRALLEKLFSSYFEKIAIAYLGPEGSFCHEVLRQVFNRGVLEVSCSTITEVFEQVRKGTVTMGIVPFENSVEGIVHETLDNLEEKRSVYVNMCIEHKIRMCLAVSDDVNSFDDIKILYAQPYALAQCRSFVSRNLSHVEIIQVSSTSRALEKVKSESSSACLCSCHGAQMRGVKVLAEDVQDWESYTRFIVISRMLTRAGDRVSLLFTVRHEPGALYRALEVFAKRGINLTMIYSRPLRRIPWRYYFYLEYEGELDEDVLHELEHRCTSVRIVGQYPLVSST